MKDFEMAHADNPREMIKAAQQAILKALEKVILQVKGDAGSNIPGLTWEQIAFLIDGFKKKEPIIYET